MEVGASKIKKFKRALRRDPNSSDANFGLGLVYFKRGELVEALPYAQKASQIDPASADAKALLGSIYMGLERDAKADECLAEAIKLNAGNYDSYSRLAEVRYRRSDIAGAIRILQDATALFPRSSQTFNDLGVMYYVRGDLTEAEKQFNKARDVDRKDRDALFNLSVIYLDQGEADKAAEALQQLIEVEPNRPEHHASLGRAYQAAGNPEDAATQFAKAVALNPNDAEAHYGLGVNLLQLGQRDGSVKSLERCLELQPEHSGAIFAMIGCLAKEGKTSEIARLWEQSVAAPSRAGVGHTAIHPKLSAGRDVAPVEVIEKIERTIAALAEEAVELSMVVPAPGDAENIRTLHDKLTAALEFTGKRYEIVYVDDDSSEDMGRILRDINRGDDRARIVSLARAYGRAASLEAGLDHARGDIIVTVDMGLQTDPEHIRTLLEKMEEGYDVVSGVLKGAAAKPFARRVRTLITNLVTVTVAGIRVRDYRSALAAYDRSVLQTMRLSGEIYRFLPAIADGLGFAVADAPIEGHPVSSDESRHEPASATLPVLDVIAARFLANPAPGPMRYFGRLSLCSMAVGALVSIVVVVWAMLADGDIAWVAVPVSLFALLAVLMVTTGFIVEILVRTYRQTRGKPSYAVKEVIE